MAAAGNKLVQEIYDQFLVCKVCFEPYRRPKTLACMHVFCTECLEKHYDAEVERSYRYLLYSRAVTCPICRKKTEVPSGGLRRLPDNFLVSNLTEVLSRRRPDSKVPICEICKPSAMSSRQAVTKCLDCGKLLCSHCVDTHRRTKVTQDHCLIDTEVEKDIECKIHKDETVRFFCQPCEMCICVLCTFQEHKGHDVSSFSEGVQKYRSSMDDLVTTCKDRIGTLKHQLDMILKCESIIKNAEDQIRDTAIASISTIRKQERAMVDELRTLFGVDTLEFLKEKEPMQEMLESLTNTCNVTEIVLRDKNLELLLLKKEIQDKLQLLLHRRFQPPPENILRKVQFIPGSLVFGYLDAPSDTTDTGSVHAINNGAHGRDVIIQTEMLEQEEKSTTMGKIQYGFDADTYTQTLESGLQTEKALLELLTQRAPTCNQYTMTPPPRRKERFTMTEQVSVMRRKVQTEQKNVLDKRTGTDGTQTTSMTYLTPDSIPAMRLRRQSRSLDMPITNERCTNTTSPATCHRSTLTICKNFTDQTVDTYGLVQTTNKLTCTPHIAISTCGTSTDITSFSNRGTMMEEPLTHDKITSTPKPLYADKVTEMPHVVFLDMGINTRILGENKSVGTRPIVTTECSTGERNDYALTCDKMTDTIWKGFTKMDSRGTMHDITYNDKSMLTERPTYENRAMSPCRFHMMDKFVTARPIMITQSVATERVRSSNKSITCAIRPKSSDIGITALSPRVDSGFQTFVSFGARMIVPNLDPADKETNTPFVTRTDAATEMAQQHHATVSTSTHGLVNKASVKTMTPSVKMASVATGTVRLWTSTKGTGEALAQVKNMKVGTEHTRIRSTGSDAHWPMVHDVGINTDSSQEVGKPLTSDVSTATEQVGVVDLMPKTETQDAHTMTELAMTMDKECNTSLFPISVNACTTMQSQVQTNEVGSATSRRDLVHCASSTDTIDTEERATETDPARLVDAAIHTDVVEMVNKEVTTTLPAVVDRATGMPSIAWSDSQTNTPHMHVAHIHTNTENIELKDKGIGTKYLSTQDKHTVMATVISCEASTSTFIQLVEKATYIPQPVIISRGTATPAVVHADKRTNTTHKEFQDVGTTTANKRTTEQSTSMDSPYTSTRATSVPRSIFTDTGTEMDVPYTSERATSVPRVMTQEQETYMDMTITTNSRATSVPRVLTNEAFTAMELLSTATRSTSVPRVVTKDSDMETIHVESTTTSTMTPVVFTCDNTTEMPAVLTATIGTSSTIDQDSKATSTDSKPSVDSSTMTFIERKDFGVLKRPHSVSRGIETKRIKMIDSETTTSCPFTKEQSSSTLHVTTVDKNTTTPLFEMISEMTETESPQMVDSFTHTYILELTDRASSPARMDLIDLQSSPFLTEDNMVSANQRPQTYDQHASTAMSMGSLHMFDKQTSPPRFLMYDKASSPIRRIYVDKATSVTKGELMEPMDRFQRPGQNRKQMTPILEGEDEPFIPDLDTIREDSKEASPVSDDDADRPYTCTSGKDCTPPLVHKEEFSSSSPNSRPGIMAGSIFVAKGSNWPSSILCTVEAGTSTPPVEMEDKAIATESIFINGKMAECISKLKTVTQRLETQTHSNVYIESPTAGPIYSKANISKPETSASSSSGGNIVSTSISRGIATSVVPSTASEAGRSPEKLAGVPKFFTPPVKKRERGFEPFVSPFLSPDLGRSKARRQRLDMSQLLRTSTVHEQEASSAIPSRSPLQVQAIHAQVIPKLETVPLTDRLVREHRRHRPKVQTLPMQEEGSAECEIDYISTDDDPQVDEVRRRLASIEAKDSQHSPIRSRAPAVRRSKSGPSETGDREASPLSSTSSGIQRRYSEGSRARTPETNDPSVLTIKQHKEKKVDSGRKKKLSSSKSSGL